MRATQVSAQSIIGPYLDDPVIWVDSPSSAPALHE